jgi:hypothetical protein
MTRNPHQGPGMMEKGKKERAGVVWQEGKRGK